MEGFKITEQKTNPVELDFEDENDISKSYNTIKTEYHKKGKKLLLYLFTALFIVIIHFTVIYPIYLISDSSASISGLKLYNFPLTINWTIFSTGIYLILYVIRVALMRITPSLKDHIINEINNIGFKIQEKRNSWIYFLILNGLSVLLLFLIELKVISFNNPVLYTLFRVLFIIYLAIAFVIPIMWRFYYDGLIVKLKGNYKVFIQPYYKIRNIKAEEHQLIGIYLSSNNIAIKFNNIKKKLYGRIAEDRWLPRKRKSILSKCRFTLFLKFHEFSTPSNFQKQFLNIVLALQDWDVQSKKRNILEQF
ncbi:MAG: hypothetical protein ACFE8C_14170 [Promethearchaeota archaeon]